MILIWNIFVFWLKNLFKREYSLYLDDERNPKTNRKWVVVRNYNDFKSVITKKGLPNYISFDHDLGEEKTGLDCAHWVVSYCLDNKCKLPEYNVHSANTPGRDNIKSLLDSFSKFQKSKRTTKNGISRRSKAKS